jgi:hypothetical protein
MTLHAYLRKQGETEGDFAKRAGVSRATVFRLKRTGGGCSSTTIAKVVAACRGQVSANELLGIEAKRKGAA